MTEDNDIPGWVVCRLLAEKQRRREERFERASWYALAAALGVFAGLAWLVWH